MVVTNMKSYICTLLLFLLLLVDKSLSVRIPPSLGKVIYKEIRDQAIGYAWDKTLDRIKNGISNPEPNAPVKNIPGLFRIKQYLYNFGYLLDTGPYNDDLDQHTISAIRAYQQFFKLQVTGDLNTETIQQMSLPRCGVPDLNFDYDLTTSVVSWPKGKPQWFPVGRKYLTYGFLPASEIPLIAKQVFVDAFTRWSQTTRLVNLTESVTYDEADIKIGFYDFGEVDDDAVIGGTIIRLQSSVKTGEIRLDGSNKLWMLPTVEEGSWSYTEGEFDLESAVMHQIGHILGLSHSNNQESVMYPAILPLQQRKVLITDYDNETIHELYTNGNSVNSGRFALFGSSSGLLTTFSLGFVCMALLL
ncbi:PGBD-like superfamily [Sesbania bispinosa]|nr:PGBD-like superfamily [Sesbania bispinosa]